MPRENAYVEEQHGPTGILSAKIKSHNLSPDSVWSVTPMHCEVRAVLGQKRTNFRHGGAAVHSNCSDILKAFLNQSAMHGAIQAGEDGRDSRQDFFLKIQDRNKIHHFSR